MNVEYIIKLALPVWRVVFMNLNLAVWVTEIKIIGDFMMLLLSSIQ